MSFGSRIAYLCYYKNQSHQKNDCEKAKKIKLKKGRYALENRVDAGRINQEVCEKYQQQQQQAAIYTDSIYKALEPGELNGLKLDKKTQSELFGMIIGM